MKIFIIANFISEPYKYSNDRFIYIANLLKKNKEVKIITSLFSHDKKINKSNKDILYKDVNIQHIKECGYSKNVCLKRFISHYQFGNNVYKVLKKENVPDLIYLAVPSLTVGIKVVNYCKKNNVKLIIDVQDLWPEAFQMVFNPLIISKLIYAPFKAMSNYIYKNADKIIAVSDTYKNRALKVNKKDKKGLTVYLGTELQKFDNYVINVHPKDDKIFTLVYIGTLGASYNIEGVIKALKIIKNKNIKFLIMGDGPNKISLEKFAKESNLNIEFTGRLNYEEMVQKLINCDVAVNPISDGAAQSIINKVGDYAMAGLPVINTQECKEYRDKIKELNIGLNCDNKNILSIANAIEILYNNKEERLEMGNNNRKWAEEAFDRNKTYKNIIQYINIILGENNGN